MTKHDKTCSQDQTRHAGKAKIHAYHRPGKIIPDHAKMHTYHGPGKNSPDQAKIFQITQNHLRSGMHITNQAKLPDLGYFSSQTA